MQIDLSKLSDKQLVELNQTVVATLKYRQRWNHEFHMAKFKIGEQVYFDAENGEEIHGIIIRINQKSITIDAGNLGQWRVAPRLLIKDQPKTKAEKKKDNTLRLV